MRSNLKPGPESDSLSLQMLSEYLALLDAPGRPPRMGLIGAKHGVSITTVAWRLHQARMIERGEWDQ